MKHIKTFENFVNEGTIKYVNAEHKKHVEELELQSYPVPKDLKDLVGKKVEVIKNIDYDTGEPTKAGTKGVIKHPYITFGDVVYAIVSDDSEDFEADPNDVKILD